jgi:hypothetical protein
MPYYRKVQGINDGKISFRPQGIPLTQINRKKCRMLRCDPKFIKLGVNLFKNLLVLHYEVSIGKILIWLD